MQHAAEFNLKLCAERVRWVAIYACVYVHQTQLFIVVQHTTTACLCFAKEKTNWTTFNEDMQMQMKQWDRMWERWIESGIQLYIHVLNKCICIQSEIMFSILSYRSLGWTQLIMWCVYVHTTYMWILNFWVSEWRTKCVRCTKQMLNIYNTTTLARTHTIALRYSNCDWNALKAFVLMKFTNHIVQHSILACWNFQCNSISHWEFCTPISTYSTYCST